LVLIGWVAGTDDDGKDGQDDEIFLSVKFKHSVSFHNHYTVSK
jgi:hypothetical protein